MGKLEQARKWARRQPMLAGLAAAVTLLAFVSTLSAFGIYHARSKTAEALRNEQSQRQIELDQRKLADDQTLLAAQSEKAAIENQKKCKNRRFLPVTMPDARETLAKLQSEEAGRKQAEQAREHDVAEQTKLADQLKQSESKVVETAADLSEAQTAATEAVQNAAKATEDAIWLKYTQNLQAADRLLDDEKWDDALRALQNCPDEHRAWEWKVLSSFASSGQRQFKPKPC